MCREGATIIDLLKKQQSDDGINWKSVPDVCWFPEDVKERILKELRDLRYAGKEYAIAIAKRCIELSNLSPILDVCFTQKKGSMLHLYNYDRDYSAGVVYFLIDRAEVVYIGQTMTRERPLAHARDKQFDVCMYTPIILDRGHLIVEEMLIEHFSPKYNACQVSKRLGRKPYNINRLKEIYSNSFPRNKMTSV